MKLLSYMIFAAALAFGQSSAEVQIKAAMYKEQVQGDFKGAIEAYRRIAAQFAKQPEIAARALFQLGQCQEKLGQAEARKSYERIVREYAGAQYAAAARARLAALDGGAPAGQQATRVVWTGPNVDGYESSLSPDGRFITFPDWDTGNLGLHDLATGADRLLTNAGNWKGGETAYAETSAISRDGKQVAYTWCDGKLGRCELRVLDLNGDPKPRRVFGNPNIEYLEPRDWSPDGKWIAANLWDKKTHQIGLIRVQDGSLRVLGSGTPYTMGMGGFSSDGRYLVYTRGEPRPGARRGYIISADGKTEVPRVSGTSSAESPVWTPDGMRIVFVSNRSGSPGLWSVRVEDGRPLGDPELLKAGFGDTWAMGFAHDGSLFYYVNLKLTDIYVAGLDPATGKLTSEPRYVNERAVGNSGGRVAWLPDSKSLSFWYRDPVGALVEHTLATTEEREIWGGKSGRRSWGYTGWFPDGRTLMAWDRTAESKGKIWVFRREDSKTGEAQASWSIPAPGAANPVFSPDLMTMYFWRKDETVPCEGAKCTHVMLARDLETGRDREILRMNAMYPRNASISHDGRHMAFIITGDGLAVMLMVAPTAGGAPREIYRVRNDDGGGPAMGTAWTQDGTHVLVFRWLPKGVGGEVWSFPASGGSPEKSPLRVQPSPSEQPAVSPDGTQVAFVGGSRKSEIWVMTGLFPDAKPAAAR